MRKLTFVVVASIGLSGIAAAQESVAVPAESAAPVAVSPVQKKIEKGYRLAEQKKYAEAIATFNSVLKAEPQNQAALTSLGYLHSGVKQWKPAVKNFGAALQQEPSNQRLRMDYAYALQASGDLDGAAQEFAKVAETENEFQAPARAALEAVKTAETPAGIKGRNLLERGYAALSKGDKTTARARFEAAVKADPKNAAALKQLGFLNFEAGKLQAAAGNFEAARAVEPNDHFTSLQLGYTYAKLKRQDEAREAFTAATASADPKVRDAAAAALTPAL